MRSMNSLITVTSKHVVQMCWSLWKTFLVLHLIIPSILNFLFLSEFGPVLRLNPMSTLLWTFHLSRVFCLVLMQNLRVYWNFFVTILTACENVNNVRCRPLTSFTKRPENAVTRNFSNFVRADMEFRYCLSPFCFSDQVVKRCNGFLRKLPWFSFAQKEIGGGACFASLNKGINNWCAPTSSTGSPFFGQFCYSTDGFIEIMQHGPRECGAWNS